MRQYADRCWLIRCNHLGLTSDPLGCMISRLTGRL